MSTKEMAYNVIDHLSEEKIKAFLTLFADDNTLARMETETMADDKSRKHYNSFDEILEEL
ncbi:MAG: hypothetical protein ACI4J6_02395 [Oscillospiraceae bacterium]